MKNYCDIHKAGWDEKYYRSCPYCHEENKENDLQLIEELSEIAKILEMKSRRMFKLTERLSIQYKNKYGESGKTGRTGT